MLVHTLLSCDVLSREFLPIIMILSSCPVKQPQEKHSIKSPAMFIYLLVFLSCGRSSRKPQMWLQWQPHLWLKKAICLQVQVDTLLLHCQTFESNASWKTPLEISADERNLHKTLYKQSIRSFDWVINHLILISYIALIVRTESSRHYWLIISQKSRTWKSFLTFFHLIK